MHVIAHLTVGAQDAEAVAKDEVQRVLQMTEVRRRQWEKTWEEQRARLEQNLQMCQFFFDLRQVCYDIQTENFIHHEMAAEKNIYT